MAEEDEASQLTYDEEDYKAGEYDRIEGELALRLEWEQVHEDDGSSYWFNSRTNESQYEEPVWTPMDGTADYKYDDYYDYGDSYAQEEQILTGDPAWDDPTGVKEAVSTFEVR